MNERIIKLGVVKRIVDLTQSRNQTYTQEMVNDILTAFFDVVEEAISNGNSINLNGYMTIETQYKKASKARNVYENTEIVVPEHYKVNIKAGSKFNNAADTYTKKRLGGKHE